MYEAISVKVNVQWRTREAGDGRNMKCLLRKTVGKGMKAATGNVIGVKPPSLLELPSLHSLPQVLDMNLTLTLLGFSLALVIFLSTPPFLTLGMGMFT